MVKHQRRGSNQKPLPSLGLKVQREGVMTLGLERAEVMDCVGRCTAIKECVSSCKTLRTNCQPLSERSPIQPASGGWGNQPCPPAPQLCCQSVLSGTQLALVFIAGGFQECQISHCEKFILLVPYLAFIPAAMDSINFRVDGERVTFMQRMGHVLHLVKSLLHCGYPLLNIYVRPNSSLCSLCMVYSHESPPDKCCQSSNLVRSW